MDIRKLQRAIVDGLEDVKAQHIAVFNTEHLSSMFERVIVASGTSNRQTKALAASVRNSVRAAGMPILSTEGEDNGEWIIVDCGAAVVHVMQPGIREYYHLEEIWGGKTVRMKVGEVNTKLVKASEPERAPRRSSAKSAAPASNAAPAKAPVRASAKASAAKPASHSRPSAGGKAAKTEADKKMANRTAAYKRVATKTAAPKRAPAKTAAAKTSAAKTSGTRTAASKTAAPRKTPARKAPSRG
jgi:ribosome-associated protein